MKPLDILYTPLDVPELPASFDLEKLEAWIKSVYPQDEVKRAIWTSVKDLGDEYPWDLTFAHYSDNQNNNYGWLSGFDKEFPELVEFFCSAFGVAEEDIGVITFLPMRPEKKGLGFWHSDIDDTGIRYYFANEKAEENPLLIMPTKIPYNTRPHHVFKPVEEERDDVFQTDKITVCPVLKAPGGYYLNNVRAVHSPYINTPCKRIASFITPRWDTMEVFKQKTADLIVRSAQKYKEHAILWTAPN
jgi:hypothetical protein